MSTSRSRKKKIPRSGEETAKSDNTPDERALIILSGIVLVGLLGIILYAMQSQYMYQFWSILGVSMVIAGACLLGGGFLGFLFGIPRTLQTERPVEIPTNSSDKNQPIEDIPNPSDQNQPIEETRKFEAYTYQANTNLEQISDWLTKILVGVGLTQLTQVPQALKDYALYVKPGLGNFDNSEVFAVGLLIYYLISGFLIGFLWTRLQLAGALRQADLLASGLKGQINAVAMSIKSLKDQNQLDADALSLVLRQLNAAPTIPDVDQNELNTAIKEASSNMKAQIFYQAQDVRSANWEERQNKPRMSRTIPIFRALIACDPQGVYHLNHGQLGFALKDQLQPNWAEAERELSEAIRIRGSWEEQGWVFYEFNRALCRINLDEGFNKDPKLPSSPETRQHILDDLRIAINADVIADIIAKDKVIKEWLELNQVTRQNRKLIG